MGLAGNLAAAATGPAVQITAAKMEQTTIIVNLFITFLL
jgi:hypothetical protein